MTVLPGSERGARVTRQRYRSGAAPNTWRLEHRSTLAARSDVALWAGLAGDAAGARDQFADLLSAYERASGPEDPSILITRHNLATWTGEAGDAAGARDQFAALLPVQERVLGPEHPDTRNVRGHLAYWTRKAGNAADPD